MFHHCSIVLSYGHMSAGSDEPTGSIKPPIDASDARLGDKQRARALWDCGTRQGQVRKSRLFTSYGTETNGN